MNTLTLSQRIVAALRQLEQFLPTSGQDTAICALSGVRITAIEDLDETEHGMIELTFPGAASVQAIGALYLKLKIVESVRLELDAGEHGDTKVARRASQLLEHFQDRYDL